MTATTAPSNTAATTRRWPAASTRACRRGWLALALVLVAALAASPAQARGGKPKPSQAERAFAALLRHGDLDQLAAACPRLLDQGYTIQLQQVQRRLLAIKPAPQPLAVVLANADALLTCQAPQAALRVLERYGPAQGVERFQWLLLEWRAAHAGLDHWRAAMALRQLAQGELARLETLLLPVQLNGDGTVTSRAALDLLAAEMESLEQPKAAAEVLLSGRQPGLATANRINRAVQLMPELPTVERERLLELALDQAAAAGAWSLVAEILDRQLALPPSEDGAKARARAAQRRARVSPRIDDAYGELGLRRQDPTARRRVQQLELQLRSPWAPGGHAATPPLSPQP
jgi:hypothetical protein